MLNRLKNIIFFKIVLPFLNSPSHFLIISFKFSTNSIKFAHEFSLYFQNFFLNFFHKSFKHLLYTSPIPLKLILHILTTFFLDFLYNLPKFSSNIRNNIHKFSSNIPKLKSACTWKCSFLSPQHVFPFDYETGIIRWYAIIFNNFHLWFVSSCLRHREKCNSAPIVRDTSALTIILITVPIKK